MRKYWTEKEINYLKKWYNIKPINEISKDLNRTYPSIQAKAQRLNLISPDKKKINRKSWNKDEEKFLEKYYFKTKQNRYLYLTLAFSFLLNSKGFFNYCNNQ